MRDSDYFWFFSFFSFHVFDARGPAVEISSVDAIVNSGSISAA